MRQPISKLDGVLGGPEDEELDEDASPGLVNEAQEVSVEAVDIETPLGTPADGAEALDDRSPVPALTGLGLSPSSIVMSSEDGSSGAAAGSTFGTGSPDTSSAPPAAKDETPASMARSLRGGSSTALRDSD